MNRRMFLKWASSLLTLLPLGFGLPNEPEPLIMEVDWAEPGSDETGYYIIPDQQMPNYIGGKLDIDFDLVEKFKKMKWRL